MKKITLIPLFCLFAVLSFAQPQVVEPILEMDSAEKGEIIFIRKTGYVGCAVGYKTFINDKFVNKLYNRRYSKHKISAGKHDFGVQFYNKKRKTRYQNIPIEVEAGQTKYVMLVQQMGFFRTHLKAVEISAASAPQFIELLKEDKRGVARILYFPWNFKN